MHVEFQLGILDSAPVLVWRSGLDAKCDWFNRAWLAFTGRRTEEEVGDGWTEGVHPDDLDRCVKTYLDAFHRRQAFEMEYRLRRNDGQFRWIIDCGRPFASPDEEFAGYIGYCFDVSEYRSLEAALIQREELLREAQDVGQMGHYVFDVIAGHWDSSAVLDSIFGIGANYPRDFAHWLDLVVPSMRDEMADYWNSITSQRQDFDKEYKIIRRSDHAERTVHGRGRISYGPDGAPLRMLGTIRDITDASVLEEQLRLAACVFDNSQQCILVTDPSGAIVSANRAFSEVTGYSLQEVLGRNPRLLNSGLQDRDFYRQMWDRVLTRGSWRGEVWNRKKNGEFYPGILEINAVRNSREQTTHFVGIFSDITDLKNAQSGLERLANFDPLTGLPNRVLFADRLNQALAQARRYDRPVAVCFLDLDGFKAVNDKHGHQMGDRLLIQVAGRLKKAIRSGDTVARIGGDEFVIILADLAGNAELQTVLNRVLHDVAKQYQVGGRRLHISASIGVAIFPFDESESDLLVRHADHAMYKAKKAGRNCFRYFNKQTVHF